MSKITRIIAVALVLAMAVSAFPVAAFAANSEYLEVIVDNAPIRKECREKGEIVARCAKGAVLESTGSTLNKYLHKWYLVNYEGKTYYIYSDNVKTHTHNYESLTLEDIKLKICKNCGDITAEGKKTATYEEYIGLAAVALPAIDGPLPVGEIIAGILITYSAAKMSQAMVPVAADIVEQIKKVDFSDYLKKRSENICTPESFRRVVRYPGGLKYLDSDCMDIAEGISGRRYRCRYDSRHYA